MLKPPHRLLNLSFENNVSDPLENRANTRATGPCQPGVLWLKVIIKRRFFNKYFFSSHKIALSRSTKALLRE